MTAPPGAGRESDDDGGVRERHLTVPRTARYYLLGGGPAVREIWLACHGYGQLAREFARPLRVVASVERLVVVPEGLSRFYRERGASGPHGPGSRVGASWMTREDRLREIEDQIAYLDALHRAVTTDPERVGSPAPRLRALGFSQGAATVARWLAFGSVPVDDLILWSGLPPPDLELATLRRRLERVRLTLVVGRADPHVSPEALARAEERLRVHDLNYRVVRFEGGHRLSRRVLLRLARDE